MAGSCPDSSFLAWMSYVPTETYFILIKAYCFLGIQTLRNLSGDLSARILESRYGWGSKVSGQQRRHEPWNCYRSQSQRWMYVMCGYFMEFKLSCLFGLIMRRLYMRLLGVEWAVHSFSSFLVCEMLLLTQWYRWNVHQFNVVRMKILRQKEKKNLPAGFHLPYSSPVWLYPLLHWARRIWCGQGSWDMVTKEPSWTILLHVLNG